MCVKSGGTVRKRTQVSKIRQDHPQIDASSEVGQYCPKTDAVFEVGRYRPKMNANFQNRIVPSENERRFPKSDGTV